MAQTNPWQTMNALKPDDLDSLLSGIYASQKAQGPNLNQQVVEQDDKQPVPAQIDASDRSPSSMKMQTFPAMDMSPGAMPDAVKPNQDKQTGQTAMLWTGDTGITPKLQSDGITVQPLEAIAPHSGLSEKESADQKASHDINSQSVLTMSPDQWNQAYQNVAQSPMYQQQGKSLDNLRQMAAMAAQRPTTIDLSPLMALADAQTGSHLAQSYQHPESPDDRYKEAFAAAQKLQQDQNDMSKSILETATKEKGGYLSDIQRLMLNNGMSAMAMDPSMKANMYRPVNAFMTQTRQESQKMREDDGQLQKVLVAVNSGNPAEQKGVPLQIARLIEGARPAMAAASVESGDPSLVERITQTGTKLATGQLTKENVGQYTQFIRDMQKVNDLAKQGLVKRWRTSGTEMGLTDDAISGMIPSDWMNPYAGQAAQIMKTSPHPQNIVKPGAAPKAQGHGGAMSFDQWKASQGQ